MLSRHLSVLCVTGLLLLQFSEVVAQDFIVTDSTVLSDTSLLLSGNLLVEPGATLVLDSVELRMNCSYNGEYRIEVEPGASLYILRNSLITSHSPEMRFAFAVHGKVFEMKSSTVQGAGWGEEDEMQNNDELVRSGAKGLVVTSDGAVIDSCTFSGNHVGLIIEGANASVTGNYFSDQHAQSLYIRDAESGQIIGNQLINDRGSAALHITSDFEYRYADNVIMSNHGHALVTGSSQHSIFEGNTFEAELISFFMLGGCNDNLIRNNKLITSEVGLHIWGWRNEIKGNEVKCRGEWMGTGMYMLFSYNCVVENNTFTDMNEENGIWLKHSSNNLISGNRIEASPDMNRSGSSGILLFGSSKNNLVQNNQVKGFHRGISIFYSSNHNTLYNNSVSDGHFRSLIIDCSDSCNIYANNTFSKHPYPDFDNGTNFYNMTGDQPEWIRAPDPEPFIGSDTYITGEITLENQVSDLENTIVANGGVLTLRNCTYRTGKTGSTGIWLEPGGRLEIYNCRFLQDEFGGGFELNIPQGSHFVMKDSEIRGGGFEWWYGGPMLYGDSILMEGNLIREMAMNLWESRGSVFRNNVFRHMYVAFNLQRNPSDGLFEGNVFDGVYHAGIRGSGKQIVFTGNKYLNFWGPALDLQSDGSYTIESDTFVQLHEPFFAINAPSEEGRIQNNVVTDSYGGIQAGGTGVTGNLLERCVTGLYLPSSDLVQGNAMKDCSVGLRISSDRNEIRENLFLDCDTGIVVEPSFPENLIVNNDFIHNTIQASDLSGVRWDNDTMGNFWSDYTGFDLDGDGIGETPYDIGAEILDHYPLVQNVIYRPDTIRGAARIHSFTPDTLLINGVDQVILGLELYRTDTNPTKTLGWKGLSLLLENERADEGICHISVYKDLNENSILDSSDLEIGKSAFENRLATILFDTYDTIGSDPGKYLLCIRPDEEFARSSPEIRICLTGSSAFLCTYPGIIVPDKTAFCTDPFSFELPVRVNEIPTSQLSQLFPNPAREACFLQYELTEASNIHADIVNSSGQIVYSSHIVRQTNGKHQLKIDISNFESGPYCCILHLGSIQFIRRFVVLHRIH